MKGCHGRREEVTVKSAWSTLQCNESGTRCTTNGFFSDEGGESTLNSELEPLLRMNELDIDSLTVVNWMTNEASGRTVTHEGPVKRVGADYAKAQAHQSWMRADRDEGTVNEVTVVIVSAVRPEDYR